MIRNLTCIECPKGCRLTIDVGADGKIVSVSGNQCEKGEKYAHTEIEQPMRILTSCVLSKGLALKMIPVRTAQPIPKARILEAMEVVKSVRVSHPVKTGEVVCEDLLGLGVSLIATRESI